MPSLLEAVVFAVTVLIMVAAGLNLEADQLRKLIRRRAALPAVLAGQAALLPLIGLALVHILPVSHSLRAGILLVAACPVGNIVNLYALLAAADLSLSLAVNALSCLLSAGTMAVVFRGYAWLLGEPFAFALPPGRLIAGMVLLVAVPVLAGMAVRRYRPALAVRLDRPLRIASLLGVVLLLGLVFATQGARIRESEWIATAAAVLAFTGAALLAGAGFGRALRLDGRSTFTVALLFATRNVGLGLTLAVIMLGRVDYAVFAAVYFLAETPLLLAAAGLYRRWFPATARAPAGGQYR